MLYLSKFKKMKALFLSATLLCSINSISQISYVDTDWIIDQTQVMFDGQCDTLELDIDQDGTKDMRITSWSNHQGGIQTVTEVLMLHAVGFGGLQVSGSYISDCPATGFSYQSIVGYIYTSGASNPYANQYVKMPFKFQGTAGTHNAILYVRYQGTTITVEGYAWNPTPNGPCDCNSTIWLSLNEYKMDYMKGDFNYYNLLGQEIDNPVGIALKVYESGYSEKVYITN